MSEAFFDRKEGSPKKRIVASEEFRRRPPDADDCEAFGAPPTEIGRIISLHSSLRRTTPCRSLLSRFLIGFWVSLALIAALVTGLFLFTKDPLESHAFLFVALNVVVGPVFGTASVYLTRFRHHCGYVGENGIAYLTCARSPDRIRRRDVFLFKDADDLRVVVTPIPNWGAHCAKLCSFRWSDEFGRAVYTLDMTFEERANLLSPDNVRYRFARAAEAAWSSRLLSVITEDLESGRQCMFPIGKQGAIRVRKGRLSLEAYGRRVDFRREDLAEIRVRDDVIALREPGAGEGVFIADGVHPIRTAEFPNAQAFLMLMVKTFDIPVTEV